MANKQKLVPLPWFARENTFAIDGELIYELIPAQQKMAALPLLKKLEQTVAVDGNNQVKYADGSIGSHILDHVKYYLKVPGSERPRDFEAFLALVGESTRKRKASNQQSPVVLKKRKRTP